MKVKIIIVIILNLTSIVSFCQSKNDSINRKYKIVISHDSINGIYIPKNINDCLHQLDLILNDTVKSEILKMDERNFTINAHFGLGMWLRNNWGLWGGSRLQLYFIKEGIDHPDNMSDIILTSYYRYKKSQNINFKQQIKYYSINDSNIQFYAEDSIKKSYSNIDSALLFSDKIIDITLKGYSKLPKAIQKFKNSKTITIEECPNIDFSKLFDGLAKFSNLENLLLFNNNQVSYPDNIDKLKQIKELWIKGDSIEDLPLTLKSLISLNTLRINNCRKLHFEKCIILISKLENLTVLDLGNNNMNEIPNSISLCIKLNSLWLDNNNLTEIPKGVKELQDLEVLRLFSNSISKITLENGNLKNLKVIDLCYNKLTVLPTELTYLKNIERITMWANNISDFSDEISKMEKLQYLNLESNKLSELQKKRLKILLPHTQLNL